VRAGESSWGFYLYLPDGYDTSRESYPLLVWLRGWGNFGWEPNPPVLMGGPLAPLVRGERALDPGGRARLDPRVRGSIVIAPRLPWFDPGYQDPLGHYDAATLHRLVAWVAAHYRVDRRRLYLTGASDGGGGVWEFAARYPQEVAALVPIACALRVPASPGLRQVPIWIFHDYGDGHAENADAAFRAVTGQPEPLRGYPHAGGRPDEPAAGDFTLRYRPGAGPGRWTPGVIPPDAGIGYTLYAAPGHDAWTRTYAGEAVWRWMYAQSRGPAASR
jgi:predicted peptidase